MRERSDVEQPLWRKKVDGTLFEHSVTIIPRWVCKLWTIPESFSKNNKKNQDGAEVKVKFSGKTYQGWVVWTKGGGSGGRWRFWIHDDLTEKLKETFCMSYLRDVECGLQRKRSGSETIEKEIPFWEFLDIEYYQDQRLFRLVAHYRQEPPFPELFQRLSSSPSLQKIDDEIRGKKDFRIHKGDWRPREELESEIGAENVIYTLLDTENKLIYVGEAKRLVRRLKSGHAVISEWNFYRYNCLPSGTSKKFRVALERMAIRDLASLLGNDRGVQSKNISRYNLANIRIDS